MKNVNCGQDKNSTYPIIINANENEKNNNTYITNNHNNINNTTTTTNTTIYQHIQINAFGKENYDYLLDENQQLKNMLAQKDAFMQKLIEAIHFNEAHPENCNILMTNLQSKHIMIHNGTKFVKALKEPTFDKIIQTKRNIINGNIENLELPIGAEKFIKDKLDILRHDEERKKLLKHKIEVLCYNKKNMCHNHQ